MSSKVILSGILSGGVIAGAYAYFDATSEKRRKSPPPNKCKIFLDQYVECMTVHENQAPRPYELEWCTEEKELYNDCMDELRSALQRSEQKE